MLQVYPRHRRNISRIGEPIEERNLSEFALVRRWDGGRWRGLRYGGCHVTCGIGRGLSRRRRMLSLCLSCRRRGRCLIFSDHFARYFLVIVCWMDRGGRYRVADQSEASPYLLIWCFIGFDSGIPSFFEHFVGGLKRVEESDGVLVENMRDVP